MNNKVIKDLINLVDLRTLIHHESQKDLSEKQISDLQKLIKIANDGVSAYILAVNCEGADKKALYDVAVASGSKKCISLFEEMLESEHTKKLEKEL